MLQETALSNEQPPTQKGYRGELYTTLLLFIGFSGITGWIAATVWLCTGWTNSRHWETWLISLRTVAMFAVPSAFFLIFAAVGLWWGFRQLRSRQIRSRIVMHAVLLALLLCPIYALIGVPAMLLAPFAFAHVQTWLTGPNVIQRSISPDGRYEAYVVAAPSIDPPNHHLFIRSTDDKRPVEITQLPEDVDANRKIHWSPHSDVVVFETLFSLIAVQIPGFQFARINRSGEWNRRENGTFYVDYWNTMEVNSIEFPEPGTFRYALKGMAQPNIIHLDSLPGDKRQ